jgi:hypothetical protein
MLPVKEGTLMKTKCAVISCLLLCGLSANATGGEPSPMSLSIETASGFARIALQCIHREYPNKPDHVMNDEGDVKSPQDLHPAFYGCFDWHSCVHGHWMLVRLLRLFPELPEGAEIRKAVGENLTAENIQAEVAYLDQPNRKSFERTYGWAWLLKLAEELHTWDDPDGRVWSKNLEPLTAAIVERYTDFLPRQTYPIRRGVHANTAFGIAFAWDYAHTVGNETFEGLLAERAEDYYGGDADYPAAWEPGGDDFFSPCLLEADLMRRVMSTDEFVSWFEAFLPRLDEGMPAGLLDPATVSDRSDPKIVHLDGLNLSRAWCMLGIAHALPEGQPSRRVLLEAARRHAGDALEHVASGHYEGEHWLASFAVFMLSTSAE